MDTHTIKRNRNNRTKLIKAAAKPAESQARAAPFCFHMKAAPNQQQMPRRHCTLNVLEQAPIGVVLPARRELGIGDHRVAVEAEYVHYAHRRGRVIYLPSTMLPSLKRSSSPCCSPPAWARSLVAALWGRPRPDAIDAELPTSSPTPTSPCSSVGSRRSWAVCRRRERREIEDRKR